MASCDWLKREIGVEIDTLKNKTAIQSYFGLSLDALLDILKKNRRSIAVDPSSRRLPRIVGARVYR